MVLSTIWLSNFITALVQARLGQSSRGNDIAKALGIFVAIIVILPMYGLMYYLPVLSQLLGMNVFLLMPFAWTADLISWITLGSNGIGLTESQIAGFSSVLQIDALTSAFLIGAFGLVFVAAGLLSADRIFTISAGVRTEKITTVGRENLLLRGIRKVSKGPFGELITVSLKSFGRKAENLSKVFYGIVLATILPIMVQQVDPGTFDFSSIALMLGMMIGILGVFPFAGTGFLESKDQLWMIQSAPKGASHACCLYVWNDSFRIPPTPCLLMSHSLGGCDGEYGHDCSESELRGHQVSWVPDNNHGGNDVNSILGHGPYTLGFVQFPSWLFCLRLP
jgi:hypothetical protein